MSNRINYIVGLCKGKRVLDVGCGDHDIAHEHQPDWLHKNICKVARETVGLEYDVELADSLVKLGYNVIHGDAQTIDLSERFGTFDIVVLGEIIEHVVNPGTLLLNMRRHLAPGGMIVLSTPNATAFSNFLQVLFIGHEHLNDDHTMGFTKKNMDAFLAKLGFEVIDFRYCNYALYRYHKTSLLQLQAYLTYPLYILMSLLRSGFSHDLIYIIR